MAKVKGGHRTTTVLCCPLVLSVFLRCCTKMLWSLRYAASQNSGTTILAGFAESASGPLIGCSGPSFPKFDWLERLVHCFFYIYFTVAAAASLYHSSIISLTKIKTVT